MAEHMVCACLSTKTAKMTEIRSTSPMKEPFGMEISARTSGENIKTGLVGTINLLIEKTLCKSYAFKY